MGGVDFSIGFLRLPGARTFLEEFPGQGNGNPNEDNAYYGNFEKILGIYPTLKLDANPPGPTLYKEPFR